MRIKSFKPTFIVNILGSLSLSLSSPPLSTLFSLHLSPILSPSLPLSLPQKLNMSRSNPPSFSLLFPLLSPSSSLLISLYIALSFSPFPPFFPGLTWPLARAPHSQQRAVLHWRCPRNPGHSLLGCQCQL